MDDFVSEYSRDDADAKRYRVLRYLTGDTLLTIYLYSIIFSLLIYSILVPGIGLENTYFGINDFPLLLSIIIGIILSLSLYRVFTQKINTLDFTDREIAYHYLSSAVASHQKPNEYSRTVEYLDKFQNYIEKKDLQILQPNRQRELNEYINLILDSENDRREKIIDQSLEENLSIITEEIQEGETDKLIIPTEDDQSETVPSRSAVVLETIVESITYDRLKLFSGITVLAIAGIGYTVVGRDVALLILAAFPVLQFLFTVFSGNRDK